MKKKMHNCVLFAYLINTGAYSIAIHKTM